MSCTNDEIIKKFLSDCTLTFEEERKIIEWARNCVKVGENPCPDECPIKVYKEKYKFFYCTDFSQNIQRNTE